MFDIGLGEILVLLIVALLVFGPDRLPAMAKQAASFVRDLRAMVANARRDLSDTVGDIGIDKEDLKTLSDLRNPKSFVRQKVLDGVDLGLDDMDVGLDDKPKKRTAARAVTGSAAAKRPAARATNGAGVASAPAASTAASSAPATDAPPPFDPDAT